MKRAWELPISLEQVLQCIPLSLNFYYMSSIVTGESTLTTGHFNWKKTALQPCTLSRRFASWFCIYLLSIIFPHYVLTNYNIYIFYVIRSCYECYLAVFQCDISYLYLWNYLHSSWVSYKRQRGLFASNLLQHSTTVPQETMDMYFFKFKFAWNF